MKKIIKGEAQNQKFENHERYEPTPNEIIDAMEKCFEENIKPVWREWDKDVKVISHGYTI